VKTAIYIEDGLTQFVLTAETKIDEKVIEQLRSGSDIETYKGAFYNCRGGWVRQQESEFSSYGYSSGTRDESLIFVMKPKPAVPHSGEEGK